MGYMIYAKQKNKKAERYGPWKEHVYKTRDGAAKALKGIQPTYGKQRKRSWGTLPAFHFKIVKK